MGKQEDSRKSTKIRIQSTTVVPVATLSLKLGTPIETDERDGMKSR